MLSLPSALHIFLAVEPADMRKGFDGSGQLVRERIAEDPLSGHLFVFRNRRRDRVKILYWDRDGFALWYKRLEKGTFRFPEAKGGRVEVTPAEMAAVLEGIDLSPRPAARPGSPCPRRNPPEPLTHFACSIEDSQSHRRSACVLMV